MNYQLQNLKEGTRRIYEENGTTIYAYETKDPIVDQVILVHKKDSIVVIEAPLFKKNVEELNQFIEGLNINEKYILLVDHVSPKDFLPEAKIYSVKENIDSLKNGTQKKLYESFRKTFTDSIQEETRDEIIGIEGSPVFGDVSLSFTRKGTDFDVEIKDLKAVYTHRFGPDPKAEKPTAEQIKEFTEKGYQLILSGHHTPETIEEASK